MDDKKLGQFLVRNASAAKNSVQFIQRRLRRSEKVTSSISPIAKVSTPSLSFLRPRSQLNLMKSIQISTRRRNIAPPDQEVHKPHTKLILNQKPESLQLERKSIHEASVKKIENLMNTNTLLEYNFEITHEPPECSILNSMLAMLSNTSASFTEMSKKEKSKIVDLADFTQRSSCVSCKNTFATKGIVDRLLCEECKRGNVIEKVSGVIAQVYIEGPLCINEKNPEKFASQEFLNLFTEKSSSTSPVRNRCKRPEMNEPSNMINFILPSFDSLGSKPFENSDILASVSQSRDKAILVYRDLLTLIQEQNSFDLSQIKPLEDSIGEYSKRLRIILRELNEFIPEYSMALETLFKANILTIDSLISSYIRKTTKDQKDLESTQAKLVDQELLRTEIRRQQTEMAQSTKKHSDETNYYKSLIERYKFTVELYRKELDIKSEVSLNINKV